MCLREGEAARKAMGLMAAAVAAVDASISSLEIRPTLTTPVGLAESGAAAAAAAPQLHQAALAESGAAAAAAAAVAATALLWWSGKLWLPMS